MKYFKMRYANLKEHTQVVGFDSLGICIITAFFIGMVFTLQVIKEFLYLDATSLVGGVLSLAFIRELSPVLTSVVIAGKIGSSFTAEIAAMRLTDQIDALYVLRTDPIIYLIVPRILACMLTLPILNIIFFFTSISSSLFMCYVLYHIHPITFFRSLLLAISYIDVIKSTIKVLLFSFALANISCAWGLYTAGGSKNIGQSTTSSVVTSLLMIFLFDFLLTYFMFQNSHSAVQFT